MYVLECTFYSQAGKYMAKIRRGWVEWNTIQRAKFFNTPEELIDYLVRDNQPTDYEAEKEVILSWINKVAKITFHHPKNIPETES